MVAFISCREIIATINQIIDHLIASFHFLCLASSQ